MAMFSSQMTSTPFSVRDILNLEQNQEDMVSLDMSQRLDSALIPPSSCMLSTFKQEQFMEMPSGASLFSEDLQEDKANKSALNFGTAAFYGKNFLEMDYVKDAKTDVTFEDKEKKGEVKMHNIELFKQCLNQLQAIKLHASFYLFLFSF